MVTIREVATRAGCSVATVSRVTNGGPVGQQTRARVLEAADELGYLPNETARSLVGGSTSTVAVIVPDVTNPFFPELVAAIQEVTEHSQHMLFLVQDHDDPETSSRTIRNLRRRQVSGFVVVGGAHLGPEQLALLDGVPHVVLDRGTDSYPAPVVRSDNRAGGRLAAEHLISLGHERIAWIGGPPELTNSQDRLAGLHEALEAARLLPDPDLETDGDFLEQSGYDAMLRLRATRQGFTAVQAGNDLMAIGALRALDELGLQVPQQVSVVGFDDIHLAGYIRPGLTTIHQQITEMGRHAARLLLERDGPAAARPTDPAGHHVFDVRLVRRGSTGPVGGP